MPAIPLSAEEWQELLQTLETIHFEGFLVVSGSLPEGAPEDLFSRLSLIAQKKNVRLIVDSSGKPLQKAVEAGVYLIKPNIAELAALAGKEELQIEQVEEVAKTLIQQKQCEIIVVSLGPTGAIAVTKDRMYRAIPPAVMRLSTVGAGDSLLAGIIYGLAGKWDIDTVLRYGVACGTAACMNPGTALCSVKDVEKIFALTKSFNA
jgi:6-phosphofructokinase 2